MGLQPGVSQNLVIGKVVMRIPWIGWITIIEQSIIPINFATYIIMPIIVILIILLIIVEFVIPLIKNKKTPSKTEKTTDAPLK